MESEFRTLLKQWAAHKRESISLLVSGTLVKIHTTGLGVIASKVWNSGTSK
jgi:hypothetical protein